MKNTAVFICLLLVQFSYSQKEVPISKSRVSVGISSGYTTFMGNNFLAKSYDNKLPYCIDLRINVYKNFGAGAYFSHNSAGIKTTDYVGNSGGAKFTHYALYVNYLKKINSKWLFAPRIGVSSFRLKNTIAGINSNYYTNGTIYFIAPEIDYFLNQKISAFVNVEYGFIDFSDLKANSSLGTSYTSSSQLTIGTGIRFWFF